MSENVKVNVKRKRHPKRDAAEARFKEMAMPLAVHKELGLPYDTVYPWWREFCGNPIKRRPKFVAAAGDAQDGGE